MGLYSFAPVLSNHGGLFISTTFAPLRIRKGRISCNVLPRIHAAIGGAAVTVSASDSMPKQA